MGPLLLLWKSMTAGVTPFQDGDESPQGPKTSYGRRHKDRLLETEVGLHSRRRSLLLAGQLPL
jgi:hypothetical protein